MLPLHRIVTAAAVALGLSLSGEGYPQATDNGNGNRPGFWVRPPKVERPNLGDLPTFSKEEIAAQSEALGRIPNVEVTFNPNQIPRNIRGLIGVYPPAPTQEDLDRLMEDLRPIYLGTGTESLQFVTEFEDAERNLRVVKLGQEIRGRRVHGGILTLEVEAWTGQIREISGHFLPDRGMPTEPRLHQEDVVPTLIAEMENAGYEAQNLRTMDGPELVYSMEQHALSYLTWRVSVQYNDESGELVMQEIFLDAVHGKLLRTDPLMIH